MTPREKAFFFVGCYETASAMERGDMPNPDTVFEISGLPDGVTEAMLTEAAVEVTDWLEKFRLMTNTPAGSA